MKIGLVGPSYNQRSLPFDAQRSINLFPILDQQGSEVASLYSVPGKSLFATAGTGPVRGAFYTTGGRAFVVSGPTLYEISSSGVDTIRGTLNSSSGTVTMAQNSTQLAICDGTDLYIFTFATNSMAEVTDADLPSPVSFVLYIDGYFVVGKGGTGSFYISALNDGTSWAALDFATAEASPDVLRFGVNSGGNLWLLGERTIEVWTNTGSSNFPFRRISGAKIDIGILSPYSATTIDNSIVFVGNTAAGGGIVYMVSGLSPNRISTTPIEMAIRGASSPENMVAYAYQEEGNTFYVLTGGGLGTTLCYDLSTQLWHERAALDQYGDLSIDTASCHMFAFNKHLVGSRIDGKIYESSLDYYSDGDSPLVRERVYTHLVDEGARVRYNALKIGFETGVGIQSGQGSDPLVSLSLSKNGARTWIDCGTASIGAAGQFNKQVEFRRLGVADQMTFKIRITDPVKVAITGSYLS